MKKLALVVGVSNYTEHFRKLESAIPDAERMANVLSRTDIGGFTDVELLRDPDTKKLQRAVYKLFAHKEPTDLLLFYFSGHGACDENGELYLITSDSENDRGELVFPSALRSSDLHKGMLASRSQHQILMLDSCFSGAVVTGMTVKSDSKINFQKALGGTGRAILTSSSSTQYSIADKQFENSLWTKYVLEGIETGMADINGDGFITVEELHEYVQKKFRENHHTMTPTMHPFEFGYRINLVQAPANEKVKEYTEYVKHLVSESGTIGITERHLLDSKISKLGFTVDYASGLEQSVCQVQRTKFEKRSEFVHVIRENLKLNAELSDDEIRKLLLLAETWHIDVVKAQSIIAEEMNNWNQKPGPKSKKQAVTNKTNDFENHDRTTGPVTIDETANPKTKNESKATAELPGERSNRIKTEKKGQPRDSSFLKILVSMAAVVVIGIVSASLFFLNSDSQKASTTHTDVIQNTSTSNEASTTTSENTTELGEKSTLTGPNSTSESITVDTSTTLVQSAPAEGWILAGTYTRRSDYPGELKWNEKKISFSPMTDSKDVVKVNDIVTVNNTKTQVNPKEGYKEKIEYLWVCFSPIDPSEKDSGRRTDFIAKNGTQVKVLDVKRDVPDTNQLAMWLKVEPAEGSAFKKFAAEDKTILQSSEAAP